MGSYMNEIRFNTDFNENASKSAENNSGSEEEKEANYILNLESNQKGVSY